MAFGVGNPGFGSESGVENLRKAVVQTGQSIPASVKIGASSGVEGIGGRELTAGEALWKQRNAESTAAYNERKAGREERRALNLDPNNPRMRRAASAQRVYASRAAQASDLAGDVRTTRANNAAEAVRNLRGNPGFAVGMNRDGERWGLDPNRQKDRRWGTSMDIVTKAAMESLGADTAEATPAQQNLAKSLADAASKEDAPAPVATSAPSTPPVSQANIDGSSVATFKMGDSTVILGDGQSADDAFGFFNMMDSYFA